MGLCPLPLAALVPFRWCCCGYVLSVLSNMFAVPVVSCVCAVHDYRQNTHFFVWLASNTLWLVDVMFVRIVMPSD